MQNAHQQHFSLFNWETHATAHKSSSTRTSAVVCEPCEMCTNHRPHAPSPSSVSPVKLRPNRLPFARVVWEPRASAYHTCWPGYLSSVRRDSACSGRLLLVTALYENIVPANIEQTKKGPCCAKYELAYPDFGVGTRRHHLYQKSHVGCLVQIVVRGP